LEPTAVAHADPPQPPRYPHCGSKLAPLSKTRKIAYFYGVGLERHALAILGQAAGKKAPMPEETSMMSVRRRAAALSFQPIIKSLLLGIAAVLTVAAGPAGAQSSGDAVYGVTSLDVAPNAAAQGVALLKQYRDGALKQAGNLGVTLLQEAGWPNRFMIYEGWKDHAAYDANEKAAHTAELRDKLKPMAGAPYDRRDYQVISVGPARPATGADTVYMQLHLDVFPPGIDATLAAAKAVAEAARKGEGNLRYDIVKSIKPPQSHTTFLAAWQNRKDFDTYETSGYARQFRDTVGPLLGSPFDDRLYVPIN
jgi:quinol monooxygenase YgiN